MSNLLDEAIIDAKALREAALKNAETIVIEKYSTEVKKTLEDLLEQDDTLAALGIEGGEDATAAPAADPAADVVAAEPAAAEPVSEGEPQEEVELAEDDIPLAATDDFADLDGKNLNSLPSSGQETELNIDLGALEENLKALSESTDEDDLSEISLEELLSNDEITEADEEEKEQIDEADDEDEDVNEELDADSLVDAIMEKLTVDMGADLAGWAGRSSDDIKYQIEKEMAHRRSTDVQEELEALKKAQEELVFENKQLTEQNNKYEQAFQELRENLQDVNLSNARLLYTNRVLRNSSLNERQKEKIVEAIAKAESPKEAKQLHETLTTTVGSDNKTAPKSLSESVNRRSNLSGIINRRQNLNESKNSDNSFVEKMQKLAGIK